MIFSPQVDLMHLLTCYVGTSLVIFFTLYFTEGKIMFESVHLICVSCWLWIKIRKRGRRAKTDCISNDKEANCRSNTLTHGSVLAKLLLEPDISPRTVGVSLQKWTLEWAPRWPTAANCLICGSWTEEQIKLLLFWLISSLFRPYGMRLDNLSKTWTVLLIFDQTCLMWAFAQERKLINRWNEYR